MLHDVHTRHRVLTRISNPFDVAKAFTNEARAASPIAEEVTEEERMQQWEIHLCEDTDFAMAVVLDDTLGNARNRWIKTYSNLVALSWEDGKVGDDHLVGCSGDA
jgi:hypothetical protein